MKTHQIVRTILAAAYFSAMGGMALSVDNTFAQPAAPAAPASGGQSTGGLVNDPEDHGWPRKFEANGYEVIVYAPQVDTWPDFERINFRAAISVGQIGSDDRTFGVIKVSAKTEIAFKERLVLLNDRKIEDLTFPGVDAAEAARLKGIVNDATPPKHPQTVSLDRLVAALDPATVNIRKVTVNTAPPKIFYSSKPAVMVMFMGTPRFKPVPGSDLLFAINTNWDIFLDPAAQKYYLLDGKSWLTTADLNKGAWTAAASIPPALSKLPADENWNDVRSAIPGEPAKVLPAVYVTEEPAELIVCAGDPEMEVIPGTSLMLVTNTETHLFYNTVEKQYYMLAAGRWFKAAAVAGPWSDSSSTLPEDFKKLPDNSEMAEVLASVPGTAAANEAMIMASIPQKATINRADVTVNVTYDGTPVFKPIESTTVQYAYNSPFSVFLVDGKYYCCNNAVWFESATPTGVWSVCTVVPKAIYTIPPTSPKYNVTYVTVYESSPTTVVTGYTAGYSGETVAATGAVMFGLGLVVGAAIANDDCCWGYHYPPSYFSYGCGAVWHGGYGGYVAGSSYYGPYGGAGHAAAYNPSTGVYSRAGYAYGPNGAAGYRTAYNPATGTSAAHAAGTSPYGSWGSSAVSNGSQWATASHSTNSQGTTTGSLQTSSGASAATVQGKYGNGATVAKSSSGDYYASHNGNVYTNTGSGWEQAGNSSQTKSATAPTSTPTTSSTGGTNQTKSATSSTSKPTTSSTEGSKASGASKSTSSEMQQQSESRSRGEQNSARTSQYKSSGGQRSAPSRSGGGRSR